MKYAISASVALLIVSSAPMAQADLGGRWRPVPPPLVPPWLNAYGKSFEEWNMLYVTWHIEGAQGGDTVGRVRFLPSGPVSDPVVADDGTMIFTDEFDVTLGPATPFVVPPFFIWGERYDRDDVPDDSPQGVIDLMIFEGTDIRFTLDGKVLMDGTGTELERFMFGPTYFEEPIVYDEPQPRPQPGDPDLKATAALFAQGIGAVFSPLPVGKHTLRCIARSAFFASEFRTTWHIKVSPRFPAGDLIPDPWWTDRHRPFGGLAPARRSGQARGSRGTVR